MSEIAKLVAQFAGALLVSLITAKLAVRWALGRFKAEKLWERRVAAYADVTAALGEMLVPLGRWTAAAEENRDLPEDVESALQKRYDDAKQRFDTASSFALFLAPEEKVQVLKTLRHEIESSGRKAQSYYEAVDAEFGAVSRAVAVMTILGRQEFGSRT